ncbi:spermine synthase [Aquimarina gracilis]|uniref:Spermine synthase n=1 Tax=Aquimarina gracilis TaxID=874422 RepID=A0ABU5ZVC2_9FLAO|nr:spermine synthase [Aquimarina gracilis]MEB3345876.1 spermine synthase [Aquimarina gracilis]
MKRLLSYLWPFTKEVQSAINGTLELTLMNGKKVLDSQNANYSYGTLQRLLCYGLSKLQINETSEILVLGLGGGSIIKSLRNTFNHKGKITAVEIDQVIIDIAKNEFGISSIPNLEIICDDAFSFINNCDKEFEIVIVDIFIDDEVPEQFYSIAFWKKTSSIIKSGGSMVFNAGINLKNHDKINHIKSSVGTTMQFDQYDHVQRVNTLLVGNKI